MTDAGIPMGEGREQRAREVLFQHTDAWEGNVRVTEAIAAMLAFADTPPPAAAGDRALAREWNRAIEAAARLSEAHDARGDIAKAIRKLKNPSIRAALRTPEPNSGGEGGK